MTISAGPLPAIPGTHNSRDLGRIPVGAGAGAVRHGRLLRSDAPVDIGAEGRRVLAGLGIRTAIDLREPIERDLHPADLAASVTLVEWPLVDDRIDMRTPIGLAALYGEVIQRCGERIAGAVDRLAQSGALPAVIFCSAGKDRTGLVSALVLSAVGVEDDAVIADYTRSHAALNDTFRAELTARARAAGFSAQPLTTGSPADLMRRTLTDLRHRYGGAASYLREHGVSTMALDRLRNELVVRSGLR